MPASPAQNASADDRAAARRIGRDLFREIYIATPADVCESRDPKGHYAKARSGQLSGFTGIGNDYETPHASELVIDTSRRAIVEAVGDITRMLSRTGVLPDTVAALAAS